MRSPRTPGARVGAVAAALALCLAAACATIERPSGGPADETPPVVAAVWPDSGAVGLRGVDRLEIVFSEKVTPMPAERMIRLYPELEIRKTKWKGRQRMIVELADTLPADTVLVLEVARGYSDIHRVRSEATLTVPFATADSFPVGEVRGLLVLEEAPAEAGVVELYALPPDSVSWDRTEPLRRAAADASGEFVIRWLPADGGPWLLRVFDDSNGDMRVAEGEPQRLLPDTLTLDPDGPSLNVGVAVVYKPNTPGRLVMIGRPAGMREAMLAGWSETIAETDTGWAPKHRSQKPKGWAAVLADTTVFPEAGPNLTRLIVFADLDGDSLLTAVPDSSLADSLRWLWEPHAVLDSLTVEPGLDLLVVPPALPDTLAPCAEAPPAASPAPADSLRAPQAERPDSLPPQQRDGRPPPGRRKDGP